MREIFARFALDWLGQKLLPLAIEAAGLSPETSLSELQSMNLPKVNSEEFAEFANTEAATLCSNRNLFCSVMLAVELSQTEQAREIARCIYGLMWKDATECAIARDLDMACNLDGLQSPDFAERCDRAMEQWDRWAKTDQAVKVSQEDFLSDCAEETLWSGNAVW